MKKFLTTLFLLCSMQASAGVVALTILAEARGEGRDGMAAVACVIAQRAENRAMTPEQVCLQKWQFSCWNGNPNLTHLYKCVQAEYALYLERNIFRMNRAKIGFADHYYSTIISAPYWAKNKQPVAIVGKHRFYKLR